MAENPVYGLVCSGGGAHGAYQVGVLKFIHEKFCSGNRSPFQIFAGSSCGALNTSFYAAHSNDAYTSRLYLEELWRGFHIPGYHGNLFKNTLISLYQTWKKQHRSDHGAWALLDPKPMQAVIDRGFRRESLETAFKAGSTLGIAMAATELLSGRTCWFQEGPAAAQWNLFHSLGIITKMADVHLQASCSVPVFLPPVKIDSRYFVDGSVSLARPLSSAISMGADRLLSIASDKPLPNELPTYRPNFKPRMSHVIRMLINQLSYDAVADEAVEIEMLNRFYESMEKKHRQPALKERLPLFHEDAEPGHYRPVRLCLFVPSKRIREAPVFSSYEPAGRKSRGKRTRFMFHEKFIGELIEMGYQDAQSKEEELKEFFTASNRKRRWFIFARERSG